MEHGYPAGMNGDGVSGASFALHLVMLGLALASIGVLFFARKRPPGRWELMGWWIVAAIAPVAANVLASRMDILIQDATRPFLVGYVLFVWLVCGIGIICSARARWRQGETAPFWNSALLLVCLTFVYFLMTPQVPAAREAARRSGCKNNLKQLMVGVWSYEEEHRLLPQSVAGETPVSWRLRLLPFTNRAELLEQYDSTQFWNSESNTAVVKQPVHFLQCPSAGRPSDTDESGRYFTAYTMPVGRQRFGMTDSFDAITDGQSQTLAIVEACGLNIVWTEPRDVHADEVSYGVNLKGATPFESPGLMSSWHPGGALAAFADGRVRFISQDIDPEVLKSLTTTSGAEDVPSEFK